MPHRSSRPRHAPSVLDDLGQEITGIMAPVSICMAITVLLVKALNPEGTADTTTVAIATLAYQEQVCCNKQQLDMVWKLLKNPLECFGCSANSTAAAA